MKKLMLKIVRQMPLNTKLKLFTSCMLLPLVVLVCILLVTLYRYANQYNLIVRNVTVASEFNLDFKKSLDYKMYRCVISGNKDFEEQAPFDDIYAAREVVEKLKETTTGADSLKHIKYIGRFLNNLEASIEEIRQNTGYDQNMIRLENNVRILTDLITDEIHKYIYYETRNMADVQRHTNEQIFNSIYLIASVSAVLIAVLWLSALITSNSITRPIKELCENIRMVGQGDFSIRPIASYNDEIQTLSNSFDHMVERIGDLVKDIRREQENLRRTELKLLQAQINPHFLYNTFDTIMWLAEDQQTRQVMEITTSLSSFFRTTLSKGQDFISLREEELHVRSYLEIQQIRYRDILEYEITIPQELYEHTVPKLTLQPLVENALYHGIKQKRDIGKITVTAHKQDGHLLLGVQDDGIGMSSDELNALRKDILDRVSRKGFGLANVHERIQLYYGEEYGLELESKPGQGTTVTVILSA